MHIKKPRNRHTNFRLFERRKDGKPGHVQVKNEELDAINRELQANAISPERAYDLVRHLKRSLEAKEEKPVSWLAENIQIADEFFEERTKWKKNRAPQASKDRFRWGVKKLGKLSLLTATKKEMMEALHPLPANRQRAAISVLNSLLTFKGLSNKRLMPPKEILSPPDYLTVEELEKVIASLPRKEWQIFCRVAFATGARYGEIFDFERKNLKQKDTHIFIGTQRYKDWSQGPTKNTKTGAAFIIAEYRTALKEWLLVPLEVKKEMRSKAQPSEQWAAACQKVLNKPFTLHNLRHSYAKHMLANGCTLEDLQGWLRDTRTVVERYYINWLESSAEMESNIRRFG
jgi:integrase